GRPRRWLAGRFFQERISDTLGKTRQIQPPSVHRTGNVLTKREMVGPLLCVRNRRHYFQGVRTGTRSAARKHVSSTLAREWISYAEAITSRRKLIQTRDLDTSVGDRRRSSRRRSIRICRQ